MTKTPPRVTLDTPIGDDVDLERDDIRLKDGTRLTQEAADRIVRSAGRPALSPSGRHAPTVSLRLSEDMAEELDRAAKRLGKRRSDVIRDAIEEHLRHTG